MGKNALPLINIICEALIEQMELLDVRSLNETFNINGPNYIQILETFEESNNIPPARKKTSKGTPSNRILKVLSKSDGNVKYEELSENSYKDNLNTLIDNYLEYNKHLISKVPFHRCKVKRKVYEFYDIMNKTPPKNIKDIEWLV